LTPATTPPTEPLNSHPAHRATSTMSEHGSEEEDDTQFSLANVRLFGKISFASLPLWFSGPLQKRQRLWCEGVCETAESSPPLGRSLRHRSAVTGAAGAAIGDDGEIAPSISRSIALRLCQVYAVRKSSVTSVGCFTLDYPLTLLPRSALGTLYAARRGGQVQGCRRSRQQCVVGPSAPFLKTLSPDEKILKRDRFVSILEPAAWR
jgi:hypothetical protein